TAAPAAAPFIAFPRIDGDSSPSCSCSSFSSSRRCSSDTVGLLVMVCPLAARPPTRETGRRGISARCRGNGLAVAVETTSGASGYLQRAPSPSGLSDVLDVILDKGLVIDAYVRVSVIGIEVVTIDARIVIASVDTYLRFAEAANRLDLTETELAGLPELQQEGAKQETEGAIEGAREE